MSPGGGRGTEFLGALTTALVISVGIWPSTPETSSRPVKEGHCIDGNCSGGGRVLPNRQQSSAVKGQKDLVSRSSRSAL